VIAVDVSLEREVSARSQAQVVTAELRQDVAALSPIAFSANQGFSRARVDAALRVAEAHVVVNAGLLGRLGGNSGETARVMVVARRMFVLLARVNRLASSGRVRAAGSLMGTAEEADGPETKLGSIFDGLSRTFDREAARARRLAEVGSIVAIASLLLGFSVAFRRSSRLVREKHEEALTDPLTGLANRRRLFSDMAGLVGNGGRTNEPLALGMFDLNGFKAYNDALGHAAGDALLVRLSEKLRAAIGDRATGYRMGGDEFCVIARGADAEALLVRAKAALEEPADAFAIRCAAGSVVVAPGESGLEDALAEADKRLYADKGSTATSIRRSDGASAA
jgi:diguanylate cyclase (GGDEF)-like protein